VEGLGRRARWGVSIGVCSANITPRIRTSDLVLRGAEASAGTSHDLTPGCA
jgi:hypothetical protein